MPLQHIQLREKPTKETRTSTTSPLARRLGGVKGELPTSAYAGPGGPLPKRTSMDPLKNGAYDRQQFPTQQRGALAGALSPTKSWQQIEDEAYAKRDSIVAAKEAEEKAIEDELRSEASGVYARLITLDGEGQQIGLQAVRQYKPDVYKTLITEGYMSPEGELAKAREVMEPMHVQYRTEGGSTWRDIVYNNGETTTEYVGPAEQEVVEKGLTPAEELGWARLHFDVEKAGKAYVVDAIKDAGGVIAEGDMIKRPGENNYRKATAEDVSQRYAKIKETADFYRISTEGIKAKEDIGVIYQHDTEAVKNIQRGLGLIPDGVYTKGLEDLIWNTFYKEE